LQSLPVSEPQRLTAAAPERKDLMLQTAETTDRGL
jgi:hypothetical protein